MFAFSSPLFWYKLVFTAELLISETLATYTLARRSRFALRAGLSVAGVFIAAFLYPVAFGSAVFNALFNSVMFFALFLLTVLALKCCYNEKLVTLFFCGVIAYTTQHIAYSTYSFVVKVTGIMELNVYGAVPDVGGSLAMFALPVYFGIYISVYWFVWAFVEHKLREQEKLTVNVPILFCFAGILVVDVVLNAFVTAFTGDEPDIINNAVLYVYGVMSCSFALGMLYSVLGKKLAETELATVEELWRQDKKNYELSRENVEQINIKCHDLKHQIHRLGSSDGKVNGEYLKELEAAVNVYDMSVKTGNAALDLLIAENSIYTQKHGIRLSVIADGESLSFMSESDIYSLFGNALRNAFEALLLEPDKDKRVVHMRVRRSAGFLAINMENSCAAVKLGEDGLPVTDKPGVGHGYGMRSMRMIAEKYGGSLTVFVEDGMFCLCMILPLPKSNGEKNKSYGEKTLSEVSGRCYHPYNGGESRTPPNKQKGETMAMTAEKKKMSNKRFMAILIPIMAALVVLAVVLTCVANYWSVVLDVYLGKGTRYTVNTVDTTGLDLDYYDVLYENDSESLAAGIKMAEQLANEGIIMLKNNGALPLAKTDKLTPFGYRYVEPIYGGTGSGNVDTDKEYVYTPEKALTEMFGAGNVNATVADLLKTNVDSAETIVPVDAGEQSGTLQIVEFDPSIYDSDDVRASCDGTTGIVFIGRFGGESWDLFNGEFNDGTPHQLALSENEKATLKFAEENCDNVIVIINSSNQMELGILEADENIDAILMIGGPGGLGFKSMANILAGDVNPSGRTVDTYYANFSADPALQNFGGYRYANSDVLEICAQRDTKLVNPNYIEYEEGIYVGYRFYETAWYEMEQSDEGSGDEWYEAWRTAENNRGTGVVYPFGYGLSYSEFTQEITDMRENDGVISVDVKVTNISDTPGKDTVQIYYSAPYTGYDKTNDIEKSYVNLIGFGKSEELDKNQSQTITVTFERDEMSSYSYRHENADGTRGAYILEAGDYTISCRKNAHELYGENCERTYSVRETVVFEGENLRQSDKDAQSILNADGTITEIPARSQADSSATYESVSNKFEDMNEYMDESAVTNLSRSDWGSIAGEGSFPTTPEGDETMYVAEGNCRGTCLVTTRVMSDAVIAAGSVSRGSNFYDYENDPELGNVAGSKVYAAEAPTEGADNGLVAADLRGVDYYDPLWDDLLDQLDFERDYEDVKQILFNHNYNTHAVESIGFAEAVNLDGPVGITMNFGAEVGGGSTGAGACAYPSEVIVAATYNTDLVKRLGETIGQEAMQFKRGDASVVGWYAPGLNMHRSPFNGRNFEYYSEDGLLAGKMGAAIVSGASSQGLVCYMKHFVLNDKELFQKITYTWCNEQTFREIYLRPYEITIKEARATIKFISEGENATKAYRAASGLMTSHNHVGATWAGSHYELLTGVVRNEWGFQGVVVTDNATGCATSFDRMVRAGNDCWMGANMGNACAYDMTSNTAKSVMRNAIHNIMYAYVNSSAMNGIAPGGYAYYGMSPWAVGFLIGDIVVGLLVIAGVVWIVLRVLDEKKHPGKYKGNETI